MDVSASTNEIDDFLNGALISWLESCLPRSEALAGYSSLLDGHLIHTVWLQIDPEPQHYPIKIQQLEGVALKHERTKNFNKIIQNIRTLYHEELGQTVLILPDCTIMGESPESRSGLEQMRILLTLLLGAAVQCPNKEIFISRIKELNLDTQHAIVELIKQVTDNQTLVLTQEAAGNVSLELLLSHLIRIVKERDQLHIKWISQMTQFNDGIIGLQSPKSQASSSANAGVRNNGNSTNESNHFTVELADLKSRMRKMRQELEEKSEALMEVKEELDHKSELFEKLRTESQAWYTEAKRASTYRDEVDILRERAERADRLEMDLQKLRERLSDSEFYKTRVEELRRDNQMLLETKDMLEEQLQNARKKTEQRMALESELIKYKQKLNDLTLERDADKTKLQELLEENTQLQLAARNSGGDLNNHSFDEEFEHSSADNSLSEQLSNNAQTRAIKLELENRRLQSALDSLKESTFHESSNKILDLEKEKKILSMKVEQLQENSNRLTQQNIELEQVFQNAVEENKKLQSAVNSKQMASEKEAQDREILRMKIIDFEKQIEALTKEKQRIVILNESVQRRADDLERSLQLKEKEVEVNVEKNIELDKVKNELYEVLNKVTSLEKETTSATKEIKRLKDESESKSRSLDEFVIRTTEQDKLIIELKKTVSDNEKISNRIIELESQNEELRSQADISRETVETLQKDLVQNSMNITKMKENMEKLGLDNNEIEQNDLNVENIVTKMVKNPETFKTVKKIMLSCGRETSSADICVLCHKKEVFTVEKAFEIGSSPIKSINFEIEINKQQEQNEQLIGQITKLEADLKKVQSENAKYKVNVSTLGSQVASLNTQHIALQLANQQLAAEKDSVCKQHDTLSKKYETQKQDLITLQCLHEQLNSEYDGILKEKDVIKNQLHELRIDNRNLKEKIQCLEKQLEENDQEALKMANSNLAKLRVEHSNLKDDFKKIFSTNERMKHEYKNIQEQYKTIRSDNSRLKLRDTELTGKIFYLTERSKSLEIELLQQNQRSEMLVQMNCTLDSDRRSLMEHVSTLLAQYHELLVNSIQDKQQYHEAEKSFTDKVNNLHRQKEKLEEKIMEHYRKLESCSSRKKQFGSGLVQRIKKAGSELISRVPNNQSRSYDLVEANMSKSSGNLVGDSVEFESDNSITDTSFGSSINPSFIHRNSTVRQSLPRNMNTRVDGTTLRRGGVRGSLQSSKKEDLNKDNINNRNSVMGIESRQSSDASINLLGTAGSRRTVYLMDNIANEHEKPGSDTSDETKPNVTSPNSSMISNNSSPPTTLLMYNRISNIMGESSTPNSNKNSGERKAPSPVPSKKEDGEREGAIWYEYGCV